MLRKTAILLSCLLVLCFMLPDNADARRRRRRSRKARVSKKEKRKKRRRRRRRRRRKEIKPPVAAPRPEPVARPATPPTPAAAPGTPSTPAAPDASSPDKTAAKAKAVALLQEGNRKLDAGIYLEALRLFQKAYSIYPSPLLHFNIAQTYNELGKFLDALTHYELFVKKVKEDPARKKLRDIAHKRIFALLGKIATLEIVTNIIEAKVAADGEPMGQTPLKKGIRFMPGAHAIVLTKPGYVKKILEVKLKAGQSKTLRVKLLTEDEHARNLKVVKALEEKKRRLAENLKREQADARRKARLKKLGFRYAGWSGLGTGTAMMLVGGIMGIVGQLESRKVEDAERGSDWTAYKKHFDNAKVFRSTMYYMVPIGGALAIAGGVLLGLSYRVKETPVTTPKTPDTGPKPASIIPLVGPGNAGVMVRVDF